MKIDDAAKLIQKSYDKKHGAALRASFDVGGAQADLLKDGTLVIPGTNELSDWRDFNMDTGAGDSGRKWHRGFLRHAQLVYTFAKGAGAKRVVGHSLGAASAQIVAPSLGLPAICFASPRPLRSKARFKGEHRVLNICRHDDTVCHLPFPFLGFRQVGKVHWVSANLEDDGHHRIKDYVSHLKSGATVRPKLPSAWPR